MNRREFLKAVVALTGLATSPLVVKAGADDLIIIGERYKLTGGLSGVDQLEQGWVKGAGWSGEVVKRIVYENDGLEYWDGEKWGSHRLVGVEEW